MRFKPKNLQTGAEAQFFERLQAAFPDLYIAVQVSMSALVEAIDYKDRTQFRTYYVDYVICDPKATRPLLVVELDDPTHNREKAKERDVRKNAVLKDAGIPLVRIKHLNNTPESLKRHLAPIITGEKKPPEYPTEISPRDDKATPQKQPERTEESNSEVGCLPLILFLTSIPFLYQLFT